MYRMWYRRGRESKLPFSESGSANTAITAFSVHSFSDCPGNVPEIYDGTSLCASGTGLVPDGADPAEERHGKLGDPVQPGMAGACLLADP